MTDEILSELVFLELVNFPSEELNLYAVQAHILSVMKPKGW